ncbi:hypothetical protein DITRI_Ditri20bG0044600 [Diplodiscus trichospermus]
MVVLASDGVSDYAKKILKLDADAIVVKSIEDLLKREKFYDSLKHSERLNSGVMEFLNSYYSDFPNALVFDPNIPQEVLKSRPLPEMEQLSTLYNADVGIYMLANKCMVDESELRDIRYTLGPLKPCDWWTSWPLKPVDVWQNVREQLEESLPGIGGGKNPNDELLVKFLFLLPFCSLLFCYFPSGHLLCRTSLCNRIRHLYHIIRSRGIVDYIGVSSSSTINANCQVINGRHPLVILLLGIMGWDGSFGHCCPILSMYFWDHRSVLELSWSITFLHQVGSDGGWRACISIFYDICFRTSCN